jgi:hypothetical protein
MHARAREISQFLDRDLPQVQAALYWMGSSVERYLPKMLQVAKWVNSDFLKGFYNPASGAKARLA